ncbi:hypothetical protein [Streptomyces bluensis]|uniref:Secreted protein n=1 Tax=Streptomyces bluensis TaxID=33897 RepID=A0ABW6UUC7_9ACTN
MTIRPIAVAAALTAALLTAGAVVHRHRKLRRVLTRERAASRLTAAYLHRDIQAFQTRIDGLLAEDRQRRHVLAQADLVLDYALATHTNDDIDPQTEGGPA